MPRPSPAALRALAARDPRLAARARELPRFPGFPDAAAAREPSHWSALARAIVFQQLATAAATTIHRRVCALTPGEGFPTPDEVLALDDARLRGAGLSANKLLALRDLAARVRDGRLALADLDTAHDDEVVARIVAVRGLGEWSAHMFLLFRLGRLDVGPAGDLGVREGLRLLDGHDERPTPRVALERMECWRPLRSVGAWLMWRLVEAERARMRADATASATGTPQGSSAARATIAVRAAKEGAAKDRAAKDLGAKARATMARATMARATTARATKARVATDRAAQAQVTARTPTSKAPVKANVKRRATGRAPSPTATRRASPAGRRRT